MKTTEKYTLNKNVMTDDGARAAYNQLATETFRLSFENWYNSGFFDGSHLPYTFFDGDRAVASVSVNTMDILAGGKVTKAVQLGTVMTHPDYRNQGLSRRLMQQVMADFSGRADCVFLYANNSVLDFYPKFGFKKLPQYKYLKAVTSSAGSCRQLNMADPADIQLLKEHYNKTNPFSALQAVKGFGLLMFYCSFFYADNVFYCRRQEAVVIAEHSNDRLICYDIFCDGDKDFDRIISAVSTEGTKLRQLAFTPKDTCGFHCVPDDDPDTALFVKGRDIFAGGNFNLTDISHT